MAKLLIMFSQVSGCGDWTQTRGYRYGEVSPTPVWKGKTCMSISSLGFCCTTFAKSQATLFYLLLLLFIICTSIPSQTGTHGVRSCTNTGWGITQQDKAGERRTCFWNDLPGILCHGAQTRTHFCSVQGTFRCLNNVRAFSLWVKVAESIIINWIVTGKSANFPLPCVKKKTEGKRLQQQKL